MSKPATIFDGIIHFVDGAELYASRGRDLFRSTDHGATWRNLARIPTSFRRRVQSATSLGRRFFREYVGCILRTADAHLLIVDGQAIWRYDLARRRFCQSPAALIGSRPLNVCQAASNDFYYGEYRRNSERSPVHILAG